MRPYQHKKLAQYPDVADIRNEARKSCVGRNDDRGYIKNKASKAARRRALKRGDKFKTDVENE